MQSLLKCIDAASVAIRRPDAPDVRSTDGSIALLNLQTQIDGLERQASAGGLSTDRRAGLIEKISLRGQLLGLIADYERTAALAEQLVRDAPTEGIAYVSRATAQAVVHRFDESLRDLHCAEQLGIVYTTLVSDCASALHETGRSDAAFAFIRAAVRQSPDDGILGTLAVLYAELEKPAIADGTFSQARARYRGVSPFPIAMLDFERGRMWLEQGELDLARLWLDAACTRLSWYAPAQAHLAEAEARRGEFDLRDCSTASTHGCRLMSLSALPNSHAG